MKKFSKILKKAFPFALATALISPLYPAKENKANALDIVMGFCLGCDQDTSSNNSNLYKQKKQYNWVKPNKYDNWQCAYELTYDPNTKTPDGFKLYVDDNGDNKPDYIGKYRLTDISASYITIFYNFDLDTDEGVPIGTGWKRALRKALNVCGIEAMRKVFYERKDAPGDLAKYKIDEIELDLYNPEISFR